VLEGTLHCRIIVGTIEDDERLHPARNEGGDEPQDPGQNVDEEVGDPIADERDDDGGITTRRTARLFWADPSIGGRRFL